MPQPMQNMSFQPPAKMAPEAPVDLEDAPAIMGHERSLPSTNGDRPSQLSEDSNDVVIVTSQASVDSKSGVDVSQMLTDIGNGVRVTKSLNTTLSDDVKRGCPVHLAQRMFGVIWGGNAGVEADYLMSEEVDRIDDFLSHDWKTGRFAKFCALCLVYNSNVVLTVTISIAALAGFLQLDIAEALPKWSSVVPPLALNIGGVQTETQSGIWCMTLGGAALLVFMFFWQRLRSLLGLKPIMCFVDKLCIHQTDAEKKQAGIDGLAGFLDVSNRLVIMWSPRYFTRLWCVYEIASWLYLDPNLQKPLVFLPVAEATMYLGYLLMNTFNVWLLRFGPHLEPHYNTIVLAAAFFFVFYAAHYFRTLVKDLRDLPRQLQEFTAQKSECFCCTVGHVLPGTDIQISCDRVKVYGTLKVWHDSVLEQLGPERAAAIDYDYLEAFNRSVHTRFAPAVLKTVDNWSLDYKYVLVANLPCIYFLFDSLPVFEDCGMLGLRKWLQQADWAFNIQAVPIVLFFRMAFFVERKMGSGKNRLVNILQTTFLGISSGLIYVILLGISRWSCTTPNPAIQLVVFLMNISLTSWFYRGSCTKRRAKRETAQGTSDPLDVVPRVRVGSVRRRYAQNKKEAQWEQSDTMTGAPSSRSWPSLLTRHSSNFSKSSNTEDETDPKHTTA